MSATVKKRNILLTIIVVVMIFAVSSVLVIITLNAQMRSAKSNPTLSANDVATRVIRKMNYSNLTPISYENISRYYELPDNIVTDHAMYISGKSGTDIEITCFKLQKDENPQALIDAANAYLSDKTATAQNSSQSINYKMAVHLPYVFVAVAQDSETAVNAFENVLSENLRGESGSNF